MFRKLFSPILRHFESGEGEYSYKASHRKILFAVGLLFCFLATAVASVGLSVRHGGAILPFIVFFGAALVCIVVSVLGTDRAVARIWNR